jgi:hypothetical protein
MGAPGTIVTVPALRDWAARIGLPITEAELPQVAADVSAAQEALATLRRVDLCGLEPILIFDTERAA